MRTWVSTGAGATGIVAWARLMAGDARHGGVRPRVRLVAVITAGHDARGAAALLDVVKV